MIIEISEGNRIGYVAEIAETYIGMMRDKNRAHIFRSMIDVSLVIRKYLQRYEYPPHKPQETTNKEVWTLNIKIICIE